MKKSFLLLLLLLTGTATAVAQHRGGAGIGPRIGVYTHAGGDGAIFGIGGSFRYSFTDNWRIEPAAVALCREGCSVDISCDVHYLLRMTDTWHLFPMAGIGANDLFGWSCGIDLGLGTDIALSRRWDLSGGLRWMIQTARWHRNPVVVQLGTVYRF